MRQPPGPVGGSKPRLVGMDVLRLVAVALVLGRHMPALPDGWRGIGRGAMVAWQRGGWVGVDLFFVLSGFLVSGLLFTEFKARARVSALRFYVRRGWKIYPPFWTLIGVTVAVHLAAGFPVGGTRLAAEMLFVQSYFPGMWAHTWSLAVEEHFYLLLPPVLLAILAARRRSASPFGIIPTLAIYIGLATLALRIANWYAHPAYSHYRHLFASHLRLDALFFGVAISYAYHFHTERFVTTLAPWRRWLMVGGGVCLIPAFVFPIETTPFLYTAGLTLLYLGSGALVTGVLLSEAPRRGVAGVAALIGAYSYSIYLWHLPVREWGLAALERVFGTLPVMATVGAYVAGALAVGVVMARVVEVPALRLRDRLFPARDRGPIEESVAAITAGPPRSTARQGAATP